MSVWTGTQKEKHRKAVLFFLAQWEGFEPSDGFWPSHDFQSILPFSSISIYNI